MKKQTALTVEVAYQQGTLSSVRDECISHVILAEATVLDSTYVLHYCVLISLIFSH